jgi:hypothetical protein
VKALNYYGTFSKKEKKENKKVFGFGELIQQRKWKGARKHQGSPEEDCPQEDHRVSR